MLVKSIIYTIIFTVTLLKIRKAKDYYQELYETGKTEIFLNLKPYAIIYFVYGIIIVIVELLISLMLQGSNGVGVKIFSIISCGMAIGLCGLSILYTRWKVVLGKDSMIHVTMLGKRREYPYTEIDKGIVRRNKKLELHDSKKTIMKFPAKIDYDIVIRMMEMKKIPVTYEETKDDFVLEYSNAYKRVIALCVCGGVIYIIFCGIYYYYTGMFFGIFYAVCAIYYLLKIQKDRIYVKNQTIYRQYFLRRTKKLLFAEITGAEIQKTKQKEVLIFKSQNKTILRVNKIYKNYDMLLEISREMGWIR